MTAAGTTTYGGSSLTSQQATFKDFIHSILPPPPDRRLVQVHQPTATISTPDIGSAVLGLEQETIENPRQSTNMVKNTDITASNTTLIGDYMSVVFAAMDSKWLVQAQGNATFASTLALIKDNMLITDRRYIFFQLGGNQVCTSDRSKLFSLILDIVVTVRQNNPMSRIFFIGVLPRIVDNGGY